MIYVPLPATNPYIQLPTRWSCSSNLEGTFLKELETLSRRFPSRSQSTYRGSSTRGQAAPEKGCSLPRQNSLHRNGHTPHQPTPPQPSRQAQWTKRRHKGHYPHQQRSMIPDVAHRHQAFACHRQKSAPGCQGPRQLHALGRRPCHQGSPTFG